MDEQGSQSAGLGEEVDAEAARELLAKGEARAIHVGDPEAAAEARAPGAVVVGDRDLEEIGAEATDERRSALLVFGDGDEEARDAARKLREIGLDAAAVLGGIEAFSDAGGQVQPRPDEEYDGPVLKQPGT